MISKKKFATLGVLFVLVPLFAVCLKIGYDYLTYPTILLSSQDQNIPTSSEAKTIQVALNNNTFSDIDQFKFWIGDTGPMGPLYLGAKQKIFICTGFKYNLGQPIIDNYDGTGSAVFPELNDFPLYLLPPIGYSRDCSIYTKVKYLYYSKLKKEFLPLKSQQDRPDDIAYIDNQKGNIPFIVRVEIGTLNRFIYSVAMLAPFLETLDTPKSLDNSAWNGKLLYKFQGGIGIGHNQGGFSLNKKHALYLAALERGYAVAYSTGNRTTTHYNLRLAEETAVMVKKHFEVTYGKPRYTVGVGASGGGIQQYVIGQNTNAVIDAAIPQASFPDMITQTIASVDCELLERYFDQEYVSNNDSEWSNWKHRQAIEGLSTNDTAIIERWKRSPAPKPGASECIKGWRGTVPAIFNPNWTHPLYLKVLELFKFDAKKVDKIRWTHWNDLQNLYPTDENGYAANSWDNVGVQYGLKALNTGMINKQSFLDLNACVGGWKAPSKMVSGSYPWNRDANPKIYDPWDKANMNLSDSCKTGQPAPRTTGNIQAMNIAYQSGHVFSGKISIPIIDVRWYLEPVLDMHHLLASFSTRARMLAQAGQYDNQVIWVAECSKLDTVSLRHECRYDPTGEALDVMDQWMTGIQNNQTVVSAKPEQAIDSCFGGDGKLVYAGSNAWDGVMNNAQKGKCTQKFPVNSNSRIIAGGPITDGIFKCALKPLKSAINDGTYNNVTFLPEEISRLEAIFPNGVCDYNQPDQGLPKNYLSSLNK